MPEPTDNDIRQVYLNVIAALWHGNVGYEVRLDLMNNNVRAVVDNTLDKIRVCSAALQEVVGILADTIWDILYPDNPLAKKLENVIESLWALHEQIQDGGDYNGDITTWMNALNGSYAVCVNTSAATNRTALATALLDADMGWASN